MADGGIESHAECAEKGASVDCAVVAGKDIVGSDNAGGELDIDRDADVPCKAVARTGGEDTESCLRSDEAGGHLVDGAVAAAGEDAVVAPGGSLGGDLRGVTRTVGKPHIDIVAHAAEMAREPGIKPTLGERA